LRRADIASGLADAGHDDTLQLRDDADAADLWLPYVYVEHELRAAPSAPWSGVVTITRQPTNGAWTIQVAQRDAGVLAAKRPAEKVGRLTAEQAEIARLTRELERANRRLQTTEVALDIMGKAHALLETLSESADSEAQRKKR
jgi:hypothetical protein